MRGGRRRKNQLRLGRGPPPPPGRSPTVAAAIGSSKSAGTGGGGAVSPPETPGRVTRGKRGTEIGLELHTSNQNLICLFF